MRYVIRASSDGYAWLIFDADGKLIDESGPHWEDSGSCERAAAFIMRWKQDQQREHANA